MKAIEEMIEIHKIRKENKSNINDDLVSGELEKKVAKLEECLECMLHFLNKKFKE